MEDRSPYRWLLPRVVAPLYEAVTGRRPWTAMRRLQELQWHETEHLETRSLRALQPLLAHAAAHVPHYRDLLCEAGLEAGAVRTLADLSRVPVTTRRDVRTSFPERIVADNLPASRRLQGATSGSSGLPLEFFTDRADADIRRGSYLFFRDWAGAPPWYTRVMMTQLSVLPPLIRPSRRKAWSRRALLGEHVTHLHTDTLAPQDGAARLAQIARRGPYFVYGAPSYIARLAAGLLDANLATPVPAVVVTCGESLTPTNQASIERGLRTRVVNHYSTLEILYIAQTCPDQPALLHVNSERVIVRIVRDDGQPADPGETGRVVVTDLANYVMPLINYDLGDIAAAGGPCPCGRGFPTLAALEGRGGEVIRTPARTIPTTALGHFIAGVCQATPFVWEYQAIQTAPDRVTLLVVPTSRFSSDVAQWLRSRFQTFLGPGVAATLEVVDRIDREPSGKRLVIRTTSR
jgi:phenylacetate-CoA ligase